MSVFRPAVALLVPFASPAIGVGSSFTAIANGVPCPFPLIPFAKFRCRLASQDSSDSPSFGFDAVGVGSRFTTTSFSGREFRSIRFDSPDFQSLAAGVGRRETAVRRSMPPSPCEPAPFVSEVRGVGISRPGVDEDALAAVGSADLGRCDTRPFRIEPEDGQVAKNGSKCPQ
ncbi:hypothetical protein K388_05026 [Streptomyces sp. KhCrAH-43]|nr:hypothetical protein K388_05026 [Streptomyces sp. KhCrAH-43]